MSQSSRYSTDELFQVVARIAREDQQRALARWNSLTPQQQLEQMRAELKQMKEREQCK
jgi:hypothetical protein